MLNGNIVASAAEFALKADPFGVEWSVVVPWRSTLWVRVVMVVAEVSGSVVVPAAGCVDEARWIESGDGVGDSEFWVVLLTISGRELAPAFVIDDLENRTHQLRVHVMIIIACMLVILTHAKIEEWLFSCVIISSICLSNSACCASLGARDGLRQGMSCMIRMPSSSAAV